MNKKSKFFAVALSSVLLTGMLAGCGEKKRAAGYDPDAENTAMSQLKVSNFEGGYGKVWLEKMIERFEEKYKDYSFEPGKTGVNVQVYSSKNGTAGSNLVSNLLSSEYEVFFAEDVFMYNLVSSGVAADITDIVTGSLSNITDGKETGSIADKLDPTIKNFYDVNGKYYALPHYEAPKCIVYDVDLFDQKGLWMTKDGEFVKKTDVDASELSTGPDGQMNTYDDGLPNTFDDFFALCDYMADEAGVTPFTWTGQSIGYTTTTLVGLWADYEGKDQFYLNFSMDGTATSLVNSMSGSGASTNGKYTDMMAPTKITNDNAYLLQRQAGKYVALEFAKKIATNSDYYTAKSYGSAETNLLAQDTYLRSRVATSRPIAFLMEGVWWENEAAESGTFRMLEDYGVTRESRRFGMMPFPKASADMVGQKRTIADSTNNSAVFIRKNIADENQMKLAKTFVQFCYTDNELQEFTVNTSTMRPVNYSMPQDKLDRMTYFGKDVASTRNNPNIETVYCFSDNSIFINNNDKFYLPDFSWKTSIYERDPFLVFHDNKDITVKNFFDQMVKERENDWSNWNK